MGATIGIFFSFNILKKIFEFMLFGDPTKPRSFLSDLILITLFFLGVIDSASA